MTREDKEQQAVEYVLGTLTGAERAQVERDRLTDRELDAAIRDWELRLGPLNETAPEAVPSPGVWHSIEERIGGQAAEQPSANVIQLRRKLTFWRGMAAAATALAAAIAVVAYLGPISAPQPGERYVAVATSDQGGPALLVTVDTATRTVEAFPVRLQPRAGHSLELWYLEGQAKPRSLGLIEASNAVTSLDLRNLPIRRDGLVAVSLEPPGGSPTGAPTGPVLYTGKLVPGPTGAK